MYKALKLSSKGKHLPPTDMIPRLLLQDPLIFMFYQKHKHYSVNVTCLQSNSLIFRPVIYHVRPGL